MPKGGSIARSEQQETLEKIIQSMKTSSSFENLLKEAENEQKQNPESFSDMERILLKETRKSFDREVKVPVSLSQKLAKLKSIGPSKWIAARTSDDKIDEYNQFLQEFVDLQIERAKYIDNTKDVYDVLLQDYSRGIDSKTLNTLFSSIKKDLVSLIQKISEVKATKNPDDLPKDVISGKVYPTKLQEELSYQFSSMLGFDMKSGRLDTTGHPFTVGVNPTDVRITTRYKEDSFIESLTGTIHETGHGIFEQQLPIVDGFPVYEVKCMALHESQSLFYERMIGLSENFWKFNWKKIVSVFTEQLSDVSAEDFYRTLNIVSPGLNRIAADECTYPLHIILRMEIEKELFQGGLLVKDIPSVWNSKMKEYLNVDVPSAKEGYLQDLHWGVGYFGYFPTYLLGAMYAVQIFNSKFENINIDDLYEKEEYDVIKSLLKDIHTKELFYESTDDLIKEVTGSKLDPNQFLSYLTSKYSKLYNLD